MFFVLKLLASLLGSLSPASADKLARTLTTITFDVLRLRRGLILRNIDIAFGPRMSPEEKLRIGRESVYNFALTMLEFFRSESVDIAGSISVNGAEHIREALARNKGVYVLCFHMGNWEAMGAACTRFIAPSHVLVKRVGSSGVNRFVSETRARNGFLSVRRQGKGDGYKAIVKALSKGEIIGFVMDQARPGNPRLPFFGKPAKTNTSFAAIWRRHPAPIVPAYIVRKSIGSHVIEFMPEVKLELTQDEAADVNRHSVQFNQVVEQVILRKPEQYFWMHNRWK